ncbi:hypothetical protein PFLUV_G00161370 [Perca fluviatilis]|uniref:UPAR/Ly6 domain-containing protein n=1 Tax=Perca fluviatilis TaxID=8168 RepID=A0A6A5E1V6_PERFL|nr:hypothetical protein PFLUV_G00161370 [Perca fluviatilis]
MVKDCGEYSINYGFSQAKVNTECAPLSSNTSWPSEPQYKPTGKQCYWCNGRTCTNTINCEENEGLLLLNNRHPRTKCDQRGLCVQAVVHHEGSILGPRNASPCCQGNLCNGASNHGASLVLLLSLLGDLLLNF